MERVCRNCSAIIHKQSEADLRFVATAGCPRPSCKGYRNRSSRSQDEIEKLPESEIDQNKKVLTSLRWERRRCRGRISRSATRKWQTGNWESGFFAAKGPFRRLFGMARGP